MYPKYSMVWNKLDAEEERQSIGGWKRGYVIEETRGVEVREGDEIGR